MLDTGGGAYFPVASGTALPGATVTVSAGGATTTVTADATTGAWSATAPIASTGTPSDVTANAVAAVDLSTPNMGTPNVDTADAGIADAGTGGDGNTADQTVEGVTVSGTVSVTQTADGATSAAATAPYSLTAPTVGVHGVLGNGSPIIRLSTSGLAGAQTEIFLDGSKATPLVIRDGEDYLLVGTGTHEIAVRYTDGSGRFGPSTHVSVTVGLLGAGG